VIGRVFTVTTPPPYELPKFKMVSGLRSETYPRPASGGAQAGMGGTPPRISPDTGEPGLSSDAAMAVGLAGAPGPRVPAGGGLPVEALGGGDGGAAAAAMSIAAQVLPGLFGGQQAPLGQFANIVKQMTSLGPDMLDHMRSANGLVFHDTAGAEKAYLQAQK